jgi:TrpR-related protein YerC/YecD
MKIQKRKTYEFRKLSRAFIGLKTEKEVFALLRDICSISEMSAMAERLDVAEQVEKWVAYRTIAKNTGASTATITRVAHWLHNGMGGYHSVLARTKTW